MLAGFDLPVYLSVLTCVLLACVAGLLMVVAQQVKALRREAAKAPVLQDDLGRFLLTARQGVEELKTKLLALGPQLDKQIEGADKRVAELDVMLVRCEKMALRLEAAGQAQAANSPAVDVVVANGVAAREPQEAVAHDPLETLLAGLKEARAGVVQALEAQGALFDSSAEVVALRPAPKKVVSKSEEALKAKVRRKAS